MNIARMSPYMRRQASKKKIVEHGELPHVQTTLYVNKEDDGTIMLEIVRDCPSYNHSYPEQIFLNQSELKKVIESLMEYVEV